jgi:hypothetical protein
MNARSGRDRLLERLTALIGAEAYQRVHARQPEAQAPTRRPAGPTAAGADSRTEKDTATAAGVTGHRAAGSHHRSLEHRAWQRKHRRPDPGSDRPPT